MSTVDEKPFDPATFEGAILEFRRALCSVHGTPFRPTWPAGYPLFIVRAFQEITAIKSVWDEARKIAGLADGDNVPAKVLEKVLDARPLCCRLPPDTLAKLYEETKIGVLARCDVCHRKALGTPIKATNVTYSHCCFTCVASASATPQSQV